MNNAAAYGLTLSQLVYDFGKTNASINQQKSAQESYRYKLLATLSDVAEQTATAYLDVLKYQDLTKAVEDNITALEDVRRFLFGKRGEQHGRFANITHGANDSDREQRKPAGQLAAMRAGCRIATIVTG